MQTHEGSSLRRTCGTSSTSRRFEACRALKSFPSSVGALKCQWLGQPSRQFPAALGARPGHPSVGGWLTNGGSPYKCKSVSSSVSSGRSAKLAERRRKCKHRSAWSRNSTSNLRAYKRVRPNPSVEPTRSGVAPWPRGFHVYHPPRGQGTTPPRSAHLKR